MIYVNIVSECVNPDLGSWNEGPYLLVGKFFEYLIARTVLVCPFPQRLRGFEDFRVVDLSTGMIPRAFAL